MAKSIGLQGGRKLKAYMRDMERKLTDQELEAGFLEGANYPDGISVAMVAAANEYGNPAQGRPPRPFFRDTIAAGAENWPGRFETFVKASKNDVSAAMKLMGMQIQADIQESITRFDDPPLALSTIRQKGFSKPLIDSSTMLKAVDWRVGGDDE